MTQTKTNAKTCNGVTVLALSYSTAVLAVVNRTADARIVSIVTLVMFAEIRNKKEFLKWDTSGHENKPYRK
jgi:hypothetical protein